MNQILDYNPNKSSGGGTSGSDKIVRVFAALLACFAICLLVGGGIGLYKNKQKNDVVVEAPTQAKIEVQQQDTKIIINVSHDKAIEKLIYSWDSEKETSVKGTGKSTLTAEVPVIAGTHTLNIKVIDIEQVETTHEQEFTSDVGEDKLYPVIALEVTDQKKLKITATDETAIDFVTYRWNDDEEQRVDVSEDETKIEFEIDILKGKNDLIIIAVDKNGNSTTEPKSFTGVTKPDVKITIAADKKTGEVYCYHENGIKEIALRINEIDYQVDIGTETPTEVTLPLPELTEEKSTIVVKATSIDDTVTEVTEEVVQDPPTDDITISIEQVAEKPEVGNVIINAPAGIKEIKLNINDVDYDVGLGEEVLVDVNFEIPLVEGNNKVVLKVININNAEKEEIKEIVR